MGECCQSNMPVPFGIPKQISCYRVVCFFKIFSRYIHTLYKQASKNKRKQGILEVKATTTFFWLLRVHTNVVLKTNVSLSLYYTLYSIRNKTGQGDVCMKPHCIPVTYSTKGVIPSRVKYGVGVLRQFVNRRLTRHLENTWNHILDATPHFHSDKMTIILRDIHEFHERRMYTYTHDDRTGFGQLCAGKTFNTSQLSSPYQRILRDEVLGEWWYNESKERYELHVYCRVSGDVLWWPAPATLRSYIFQRDMNLVIESIAYGDMDILKPHADETVIYVHLRSHLVALQEIIEWGLLGDKSSWHVGPSKACKARLNGSVSIMAIIYSFLQKLVEKSTTNVSLCTV